VISELRECPVPGCTTRHKRELLMCGWHWKRVPEELRKRVWRTFKHDGVLSEEYQEARDAAIESVTT
jgi:hypothetical protein